MTDTKFKPHRHDPSHPDLQRTGASERAERVTAVLDWGVPRLRQLPWRQTRDPWEILVSEVMLQQTQVDRVIPKWRAFLDRFPTAASCAHAPLADVLRLWQGLGYPRRARNLHNAARMIADQLNERGRFPQDLDELMALPGVGPYTARAVLVFAFEQDAAVVDTNIARIFARLTSSRLTPRQVQRLADDYLPMGRSWDWNQSLMDLGAAFCRPVPLCSQCPLRSTCRWSNAPAGSPDPATGSAGVSVRQTPFEGSDRQARGRLMKALNSAPVLRSDAARLMGRDDLTAGRLVDSLVKDGLCWSDAEFIMLPS